MIIDEVCNIVNLQCV